VEIFRRDGSVVDVIGRGGKGTLGMPRGIVVDSLGRLHIVDTTGQTVEVWDISAPDPARLYTIGSEGVGDSQFSFPNGIALDSTGRVYVTDRANSRLAVWSY
jgi:DNA-binding beta-propeller fold protein YncE